MRIFFYDKCLLKVIIFRMKVSFLRQPATRFSCSAGGASGEVAKGMHGLLRKTNFSLLTISDARFLYLKVIQSFQQVKHAISWQWLDFFFHWRVCLFRVVVYNSLVRYWRVPCLQFYWNFKSFRTKARGYIFLGIWRTIPGPLGLVSTLRNSITIAEWLIDWLTDEWFRTRNSVDSPAGRPLFDNEDEPLEI